MVRVVELNGGGFVIAPGQRVIPADAVAPLIELDEALSKARAEAGRLVEQAKAEAGAVRAQAREDGLAEAKEVIAERLIELAEASTIHLAKMETRVIDLALRIAERVVGELDDREKALLIARRVLSMAQPRGNVRLRVAPAMAAGVAERLSGVLPPNVPDGWAEVVADPNIKDAGCILETDAGLIDATIDSQLSVISRALRRTLAEGAS